ncbi:transcriptional antiterminator, Rof [Thioalkalivibrio sulfidiphilus]|uniref:Transcriptional antiterminator, Rof n=1 Tax=Thioalkalivibrio sulfidiphilus (strain HL-EbGR7) TaxID=396588 RepID=B8GPB7_THISH|nr:transcriptional antiterminator, Rof [Thioalkalivibrio sulfidiphilus]ACL74037.1 transcriptional antiterminator, Rof [Thioalkalivibrio sulfidiphilus HL-EbGr7]
MTSDYTPISCELYSEYELAIMRGRTLKVRWKDRYGMDRVETLRPTDLRTRRHAEFMIARNQLGQRRVLRLDRIVETQERGEA